MKQAAVYIHDNEMREPMTRWKQSLRSISGIGGGFHSAVAPNDDEHVMSSTVRLHATVVRVTPRVLSVPIHVRCFLCDKAEKNG